MTNELGVVLALYPNAYGMGYACLDWSSKKIIDSGIAVSQPLLNSKLLDRAVKFLDFYQPTVIVLRDCAGLSCLRAKRSIQLLSDIEKHAQEKGLKVFKYSRQHIRDVFQQFKAQSKYEISQRILELFPDLTNRTPKLRKPWMNEDFNMGVFDAVALAITHQYLGE